MNTNSTRTARTAAVGVLAFAAITPMLAGSVARALIPPTEDDPVAAAARAEELMHGAGIVVVVLAAAALLAAMVWSARASADVRFRLLALGLLRVAGAVVGLIALREPAWQVWQLSLALALVDASFWFAVLSHAARTLPEGDALARNTRHLAFVAVGVRMSGLLTFALPAPWDAVAGPCYRAASLVAFAAVAVVLLVIERRDAKGALSGR